MTVQVKLSGVESLVRALNGDMRRAIRIISYPVAQRLKGIIAKYPSVTEANRPRSSLATKRTLPWYVRGWGQRWWSTPGKRWPDIGRDTKRDVRYGSYWGGVKTSETLNRSWAVGRVGDGSFVGSRASYSPLVHHYKDQAGFHKRRGWVTDKQAVDRIVHSGELDRIAQQAIDRVLKGRP